MAVPANYVDQDVYIGDATAGEIGHRQITRPGDSLGLASYLLSISPYQLQSRTLRPVGRTWGTFGALVSRVRQVSRCLNGLTMSGVS